MWALSQQYIWVFVHTGPRPLEVLSRPDPQIGGRYEYFAQKAQ
jgi:hypothetical protein